MPIIDDLQTDQLFAIFESDEDQKFLEILLSNSYDDSEKEGSEGPQQDVHSLDGFHIRNEAEDSDIELELLITKPDSVAKRERRELKEIDRFDYHFDKTLRRLSNKLLAINKERERVREELAEAIRDKQLSARETRILESNNCCFKRKRAETDLEEAKYIRSGDKNTLAEGDRLNFVYTGQYGDKQLIAGKVRHFLYSEEHKKPKQVLCSPSYPAVVDIVFHQDDTKLHPVFGKKGKRHLLKEGLEETVSFHK